MSVKNDGMLICHKMKIGINSKKYTEIALIWKPDHRATQLSNRGQCIANSPSGSGWVEDKSTRVGGVSQPLGDGEVRGRQLLRDCGESFFGGDAINLEV